MSIFIIRGSITRSDALCDDANEAGSHSGQLIPTNVFNEIHSNLSVKRIFDQSRPAKEKGLDRSDVPFFSFLSMENRFSKVHARLCKHLLSFDVEST